MSLLPRITRLQSTCCLSPAPGLGACEGSGGEHGRWPFCWKLRTPLAISACTRSPQTEMGPCAAWGADPAYQGGMGSGEHTHGGLWLDPGNSRGALVHPHALQQRTKENQHSLQAGPPATASEKRK